MFPDQT